MPDLRRESGVDSEVARTLTGHTQRAGNNRDAAAGYGGEFYLLKPLFATIQKIEFPTEVCIPILSPERR
jgi:hypothetical protein